MTKVLLAAHYAFVFLDNIARAIGWFSIVVCAGALLLAIISPELISSEEPRA